jgi:quercetin dioxygenase-like cupin family protein
MKNNIQSIRIMWFSLVIAFITPLILFSQESNNMEFEKSVVMDAESPKLVWGPCPEFMPNGCEIAVLHGDPSKDNVDILFKVPSNTDIPKHWHNSAERMILVSGEMDVTYDGEKTQTLKQGNYAYGPAKKPHSARCGDSGPCVLFIGFEKPLDAMPINK